MSTNLDLVRSIYADWERGEFGSTEWAHREIEFVSARELDPGSWTGLAGMREGERRLLDAWEDFRKGAEEFRELDAERVLVLTHRSGRGKRSGLELERLGPKGAELFHVRDGKVTKLVLYEDRYRAFADLGLKEQPVSQNVEIVNRAIDAFNRRDVEAFAALVTPDFAWLPVTPEGSGYRGRDGIERYFAELRDTWGEVGAIAQEYRDLGDRVLILGRFEGRGRGSSVPVHMPQGTIFDLLNGKVSHIRSFLDQAEALRAAGLEE